MKHKPILLLCLLVGPALARPNAEPIYYRSNAQSNPLEVTEELIPTTNVLPLVITEAAANREQDQPKALELRGTTTTEAPVTTTTTSAPATTQDQNSRYTKFAEPDPLSSESIIKDFFLKNLANFQKENVGNFGAIPSLVEEPNTLRSVSLAPVVQSSPIWGDPGPDGRDPQYSYMNVRKKPIIHKIITKWSDKTQDAFNVDFAGQHGIVTPGHLLGNFAGTTGFIAFPTATPVPIIIVTKPVYPENTNQQIELSLMDNGYSPEPERDVVYQSEPQNDGYQVQQDPIDSGYSEPPKQVVKKKKKKNKNKTKKPEKQQTKPEASDPDRPDAAYWNDQVEQLEPSGWQQGDDQYEEKDPYADAVGALKDQPVIECNGIRISVNGKEACDEIEVTINRVDEITKNGFVPPPLIPLIPPVVPVAPAAVAADPIVAAGAAGGAAAEPSAALAAPVANDASLFAAPLDPLAAIPPIPPAFPGPISFLTSPIGNLMNNIMQPTRLGTGPGTAGNKNKHKPHEEDAALNDGGSSMLTDTSHALFGMLAALSAMTPMNIIVMALASLPVMALVMAGVGAGMYMYSKFTPPIKNYSTIVVKRPLPVIPSSIHRYKRPVKAPSSGGGSSGWFDFNDMWSNIGWTADDRRGVGKGRKPPQRPSRGQPAYRLSPYRGHRAKSASATTKRTGR